MTIKIYDTTLRDGSQAEGVSLSVEDKLKITKKLDDLGIHYIEGGWPGSNPKDIEYFKQVKKLDLKKIKVSAFCSTRYKNNKAEDDPNLLAVVNAEPDVGCIFGKTWDLHVKEALRCSLDENLEMIYDSVKFLKSKGLEVIYDAEHFFDGFKANKEYAMETLRKAEQAGADNIALCDTNGGCLPHEIGNIIDEVKKHIKVPLGIHTHNDSGMAAANSIIAVVHGAVSVQGTINGYGERCGNADLCVIIPALALKLGNLEDINVKNLTETSFFVSELANMVPMNNQPYVGLSAFAHKAGIHVSAVQRNTKTYEHMDPELVGNERRILISELSGKSNILEKTKELNIRFANDEDTKKVLKIIKEKESQGYQYEGADASLELLLKKTAGEYKPMFEFEGFRVIVEKDVSGEMRSEATVKIKVGGVQEHTAAEGDGPVNALDNALRSALEKFYPVLKDVSLTDFKVRVINAQGGTAAKVRVLIESRDLKGEWITIGVSENIIEASWYALADSIEYKLLKKEY